MSISFAHLKEHDLPVCALGICGIGEGIEDLFQGHNLTSSTVDALPHNTIGLHVTANTCGRQCEALT